MKSLIRNQEGATAVEFAIILPVFLALIFGSIEFSLFLYNRHILTNACREAARVGIVMQAAPREFSTIETIVKNRFSDLISKTKLITFGAGSPPTLTVTNKDTQPNGVIDFGDTLEVIANFDYDFLFLTHLGIGPITINATVIMTME